MGSSSTSQTPEQVLKSFVSVCILHPAHNLLILTWIHAHRLIPVRNTRSTVSVTHHRQKYAVNHLEGRRRGTVLLYVSFPLVYRPIKPLCRSKCNRNKCLQQCRCVTFLTSWARSDTKHTAELWFLLPITYGSFQDIHRVHTDTKVMTCA